MLAMKAGKAAWFGLLYTWMMVSDVWGDDEVAVNVKEVN